MCLMRRLFFAMFFSAALAGCNGAHSASVAPMPPFGDARNKVVPQSEGSSVDLDRVYTTGNGAEQAVFHADTSTMKLVHAQSISASAYATVVRNDAPTAYYRLGEVGSVASDSSGNSKNGTDVALNHAYSGVVFNAANAMLYAATASYCDISPRKGRVAAIDTGTATLTNTFFPAATEHGGSGSGGGIWGPAPRQSIPQRTTSSS